MVNEAGQLLPPSAHAIVYAMILSFHQRDKTSTTMRPCTDSRKVFLVVTGQRRGRSRRRPTPAQQLFTATEVQNRRHRLLILPEFQDFTFGDKSKLLINAIAFRIIAIGVKHDRRAIDRE